jgi:hypothetical protein
MPRAGSDIRPIRASESGLHTTIVGPLRRIAGTDPRVGSGNTVGRSR